MAIIISQIKTSLDEPRENAVPKALKLCGIKPAEVKAAHLHKTSVDARHEVCFVSSVYVQLESIKRERLISQRFASVTLSEGQPFKPVRGNEKLDGEIFVAGFGPAGMFCALTLCEFGYKPIVLERGAAMEQRIAAVEHYWGTGELDPRSNVQFGEGGAGTFSDGKLTTRINDPLCGRVLEKLCEFGAPKEILTAAKPHIGTDKLRSVVTNLRRRIIQLGGEVRFLSPLEKIDLRNGTIRSITAGGVQMPCGVLALAVGHSAHDTFGMLLENGVTLIPKPFSVGARIEHLQADVDRAMYGKAAGHPALPPAEYSFSYRENGRGVYTFCMCPGGFVTASASSGGSIVTNGMSNFDRSGTNANSAVLVSVSPDDFGSGPLDGAEFIRRLEERAFELGARGGVNGAAPAMLTREFIGEGGGLSLGRVTPTYPLGVQPADLHELFPNYVSGLLTEGLRRFDSRLSIGGGSDSVLTAIETRSSSPVRIPRIENKGGDNVLCGFSECADNLYPCGEGAGYAGGIMSAAVDGIKTAVRIMERFTQPNGD